MTNRDELRQAVVEALRMAETAETPTYYVLADAAIAAYEAHRPRPAVVLSQEEWDAMVERGAQAVVRSHFDGIEVTARYVEAQVDRDWPAFRGVVIDTLRAALGNPQVEGNET